MGALLIGGNGFIGTHLAEALRARGDAVRVLDPASPRPDFDWRDVDYRQGAISDTPTLDAALQDVDVTYLLASSAVPGTSYQPIADVGDNLVGALHVMQRLRERGLRRVVFFSTGGALYGRPHRLPIDEAHPTRPLSSYGVVKRAIEDYLLMYQAWGELDPVILRPSNPYGPRQGGSGLQGVVPVAMRHAREGTSMPIWGDGQAVRDYLHVTDLVSAAISAADLGAPGPFNIGSGEGVSLLDLLTVIEQVSGRRLHREFLPGRVMDVDRVYLDNSRAKRELGWSPKVAFEEGLGRTWRWFNESST